MESGQARHPLESLFEAFNERDWATFEHLVNVLFHPDFRLHLPRRSSVPLHRADYVVEARRAAEEDPTLRYRIGRVIESDATAMTLERQLTVAGRRVVIPLCLVADYVDGTIASIEEYAAAPRRRG